MVKKNVCGHVTIFESFKECHLQQYTPSSHQKSLTIRDLVNAYYAVWADIDQSVIPALFALGEAVSIPEAIDNLLAGKDTTEQFDILKEIVLAGVQMDEQSGRLVTICWERINRNQLWRTRFKSETQLRADMQYRETVDPIIQKFKKSEQQSEIYRRTIHQLWADPIEKIIPAELSPKKWSYHLLRHLAQLCNLVDRQNGLQLIQHAMKNRSLVGNWNHGIGASDIILAICYVSNPPLLEQQTITVRAIKTRSTAKGKASAIPLAKPLIKKKDKAGKEETKKKQQKTNRAGTKNLPMKNDESPECGCQSVCRPWIDRIPRPGKVLKNEDGIQLVQATRSQWNGFCENHLRLLVGGAMGMFNNMKRKLLLKRLQIAYDNRHNIDELKHRRGRYFRRAANPGNVAHRLGPMMWTPKPAAAFDFDPVMIFNRYGGKDAWTRWQHDGTINIEGFFGYLTTPSVFAIINQEFNMYKHHARDVVDGRNRLGWMRHMFYSLTQQVIRQDPAYYAIMAAARPDRNWRLISYPSYTKDSTEGEKTGFAHFDINVGRFVTTGRGGNIVQTSVSLDDENEQNCTILIPGFHRRVLQWYTRVRDRGVDPDGHTTDSSKLYRSEDAAEFGAFMPVPCQRGGIRISRPEILHGSTTIATQRRRTVFVWHYGIQDDHHLLDLEQAETWEELSAFHRDLEAPRKSTSGGGFRYGRPEFRFPGAVKMESVCGIGEAMIGQRRWTDPKVQVERDIVFGQDEAKAWEYIKTVRHELVAKLIQTFPFVMEAEKAAYGERSYFQKPFAPRGMPEGDLSSSSEDSSSEGPTSEISSDTETENLEQLDFST